MAKNTKMYKITKNITNATQKGVPTGKQKMHPTDTSKKNTRAMTRSNKLVKCGRARLFTAPVLFVDFGSDVVDDVKISKSSKQCLLYSRSSDGSEKFSVHLLMGGRYK